MKTFFQKHAKKWSRCTAAALIAGGLLTIPAFAAEITPSVTKITLAQSQKSFTVDVSLQESEQFAGAEFGLKLPDGMTLDQVEFLDQTIQDAAHTPEVTADGLSFFGFYAAENVFSGKMNVARLTFIYDGAADASIVLGRSKVVTVQEDGTTVGDTSSEPFTIEVTRKSSSSSGGSSSGNSSSGNTGTPKPEQPSNPFTDLDRHWAKDVVLEAVRDGLFSGTSATTFSPNQPVTRGMLVTVLHRMEGTPAGSGQPFADVASDAYYADAVAWAAEHGIVAGISETTFAPNASVTREQMAAILYRYAQSQGADVTGRADLTAFADVSEISGYAKDALSWANASGLISGRSASVLAPKDTATRAEAASILVRFEQKIS